LLDDEQRKLKELEMIKMEKKALLTTVAQFKQD